MPEIALALKFCVVPRMGTEKIMLTVTVGVTTLTNRMELTVAGSAAAAALKYGPSRLAANMTRLR